MEDYSMGFSFWLKSNNGKSFNLESLQELVKEKGIANNSKLEKLFSLFDTDRNGKIDFENSKGEKELQSLFDKFYQTSGDNQILEESEVAKYLADNNLDKDLSANDVFEFLGMFIKEDVKAKDVHENESVKTVGNKEIRTKDGKVTEVKTDLGNGEFETTTYTYHTPTDKEPLEYVTLRTEKADGSAVEFNVLGVDDNGEFPEELIIDRITTTIENGQKTRIQVFLGGDRLNEVKSRVNGKKIHNIYNGLSFADLDEGKLNKIQQMIKNGDFQIAAFYDGNGNTMAVIQKDDTLSNIALRYGVKVGDILKINPKIKINSLLKAGSVILVPGEFSADSKPVRSEKPIGEVMQDVNSSAFNKARTTVFSSSLKEITLDKNYKNAYELAEKLLKDQGITPQNTKNFGTRKNDLAQEIIVANGSEQKAFQSGKKVVIVDKRLDENTLRQLTNAGFVPSQEYLQFYQRFHTLNQTQKQNVLNTIKVCQSRNKTSVDDIKQAVTKTFPEYYLFNEPKVENVRSITNPEKEYMELTKKLILGMYDNAIQQFDSQRTMNPLNPMFYAEGITLTVVNPLTDLVEGIYYDVCNGKKLDEKILNQIAKISPEYADKLRANPYTVIDIMASGGIRQIQNLKREASNKLNTLKPAEFKQYFKLITGQEYDPKKIEAYIQACQSQDESKINAAYDKALGTRFKNAVSDSLNWNASMSNAADIVGMLMGTSAIGKGVVKAGTELLGKETVANLGRVGKFGFSMGTNAVTMASWEVLKASAEKTTGAIIKGELPTVTDLKDVGYAGLEGAGLGVFTAAWSPVTQSLMKAIDKPIQTAVAKSLQTGAKSGKDVMTTYLKMSNDPSWIAKGAGFLIETEGFVNYQMMLEAIKTFYKNGSISKDSLEEALLAMNVSENDLSSMSTAEMLEKYLCEQFKGQAQGLLEIKMISQLLLMHRGGKAVQQAMVNNMIEVSSEALQDVKISKRTLHGHDFYEMEYPNGRKEIADSEKKVIANCQAFTQQYFLAKRVNDLLKAEANAEVKPETATKQEARTYVRKSDGKVFEAPKLEEMSMTQKNPLANEKTEVADNRKEGTETVQKPFVLEESIYSEEMTKETLKQLGYTDAEIKAIDCTNNDFQQTMAYIKVLAIDMKVDIPDWNLNSQEFRKELITDLIKNSKDFASSPDIKYLNLKNIEYLKNYIEIKTNDIDALYSLFSELLDCKYFKLLIEKLPEITKLYDKKLSADDIKGIVWGWEDNLQSLTMDIAEQINKFNKVLPDNYKFNIGSIDHFKNGDVISPEFIQEYVNECSRFEKLNIETCRIDYRQSLNDHCRRLRDLSNFLESHNIELDCGDGKNLDWTDIEKISKSNNPNETIEFINSLIPSAKSYGIGYIDEIPKNIEQKDFIELLNTIKADDFGKCRVGELIDYLITNNIKDSKGFVEYVKEYKGRNVLDDYYISKYLEVKDGDYTNAAKLLHEIMSYLPENVQQNYLTYRWRDLINKENVNCKLSLDTMVKIRQNGNKNSELYQDPGILAVALGSNDSCIIEKMDFLYEKGLKLHDFDSDFFKPSIAIDDFKQKYNLYEELKKQILNDPKESYYDYDSKYSASLYRHLQVANANISFEELTKIFNEAGDKIGARNKIEFLMAFYDDKNNVYNEERKQIIQSILNDNIPKSKAVIGIANMSYSGINGYKFYEKMVKHPDCTEDILQYMHATTIFDESIIDNAIEFVFDRNSHLDITWKKRLIEKLHKSNLNIFELIRYKFDSGSSIDAKNLLECTRIWDTDNNKEFKKSLGKFAEDLLKDENLSLRHVSNIICSSANEVKLNFVKKLYYDYGADFNNNNFINIVISINSENIGLAELLCTNKELNFPKENIAEILSYTNSNNINFAKRLCSDKKINIPVNKMALTLSLYNPKFDNNTYIQKMELFFSMGFDNEFIRRILGSSNSLNFYNEKTCNMLKKLQTKGANIQNMLTVLTSDSIPERIDQQIDALQDLMLLEPDDIAIIETHGVLVEEKIIMLQKAINVKHPIIETSKGNVQAFLKSIGNNNGADETIQSADFSQIEKSGIKLKYSREEFMHNMEELIVQYKPKLDLNGENTIIQKLELSEEDKNAVKVKIEEYKNNPNYTQKEYEIIVDGKKHQALEFTGSHVTGSNDGEFTLIDGDLYYVKYPSKDKLGQSVEEVIASQLYRAAGIDAPNEHYVYNSKGAVIGMASEYVPEMKDVPDTKMMFDSFAVDAWLANWDAPKNDNTQVYANGRVIKSDVGGSLHYRAQGEQKLGFGNIVNELVSLIEHNSFYKEMSIDDLLKSLQHVIEVPNEAIYKAIYNSPSNDLKMINTLINRKEFIKLFTEKVKSLDESKFSDIADLIIEAKRLAIIEFENIPDIEEALGYVPTKMGFEGLLNTQEIDRLKLTPEQRTIAEKMRTEIRRFTLENEIADDVKISDETKNFINGVLKGIPEFASYFGKPQHGGQKYSLDVHILKVLQSSISDPLYKNLDNESKMVIKFSTLLHDIGKRYLAEGSDKGHAKLSAEYVYSILDRFNLSARTKNRIINIVNNHHWLEGYCKNKITTKTVASMFRTTEDFTIARIMAKADLENVRDNFFTQVMQSDYPGEVHNTEDAYRKFEQIMDFIQTYVNEIEVNQPIIMPSKFVEVPEVLSPDGTIRIRKDGTPMERRGFPIQEIELDGKKETFKVLNLHTLDPETDMFKYGFAHIKLKDLRLLVHRPGDESRTPFDVFKTLGENPMNTSLQSISLVSPNNAGAYCDRQYACVVEGNSNDIGVAYYENANTGTKKVLKDMTDELLGGTHHHFVEYDPRRIFFKTQFIEYMKTQKGIEIDDKVYTAIIKYARSKQYIETQIKNIKIGDTVYNGKDLTEALLFARDQLINIQGDTPHDEVTQMNCNVVAGGVTAQNLEEFIGTPRGQDFLRACRDHCDGRIILW